jgi:hypothetical protein
LITCFNLFPSLVWDRWKIHKVSAYILKGLIPGIRACQEKVQVKILKIYILSPDKLLGCAFLLLCFLQFSSSADCCLYQLNFNLFWFLGHCFWRTKGRLRKKIRPVLNRIQNCKSRISVGLLFKLNFLRMKTRLANCKKTFPGKNHARQLQ